MFLSDSLPSEIRFRQAYTLSFYLSVMGRVSPVPNHTFHTYRFPYTEGFFRAAFPVSSHVPWFSPIFPRLNFPLFSSETFLTIRQNSLYVTVCMIVCTFYQGYFIHSLSTLHYCNAPSLTTRLTGDYRDRTYTGKCGPASLDTQRKWKKNGTDKYDFLREPWSWDSKNFVKLCFTKFLLRSPAECPANRNIIFRLYRFSFHKPIKSRLVRGRLYLPFTP